MMRLTKEEYLNGLKLYQRPVAAHVLSGGSWAYLPPRFRPISISDSDRRFVLELIDRYRYLGDDGLPHGSDCPCGRYQDERHAPHCASVQVYETQETPE